MQNGRFTRETAVRNPDGESDDAGAAGAANVADRRGNYSGGAGATGAGTYWRLRTSSWKQWRQMGS